jgi:hypothetical protein
VKIGYLYDSEQVLLVILVHEEIVAFGIDPVVGLWTLAAFRLGKHVR